MMNTWESIYGKAVKHIPRSHSVQYLHLSEGGQGPSVGLTRMSRGRQREQGIAFSPASTSTGFRKQRHRSTSPTSGGSPQKKNKRGLGEFYLQECEVSKAKKPTLFQIVGNEIGVERIAKVCLKVAEDDPHLKPLKEVISMPLAKTLLAYLLGQSLPEFKLSLPELKRELMRARDEYKLTKTHFEKISAMFRKGVHALCHNNATRLEWDTVSDCFRKEIEQGDLNAVTDKRICSFDVFLRGVRFIPYEGNAKRIIVDIINVAKQLPDPDIKRAVMRSFYPEAITLTECGLKGNGLMLKFQLLPELYDDRITLKNTDLGHTKQFVDSLILLFDPNADLGIVGDLVEISEEEDPIQVAAREQWKSEAAAITEPVGELIPVEDPDYDGMKLEKELAETLHPGPSILGMYPSLPSFEGEAKVVFEEQSRRINLLEEQIQKLASVHSKELTRTRRMLMLAQDRIGELEEMTTLLPTEAAQAQNLVFRITQDSIRRSLRQGDDDLDSDVASMQMLDSCPTPNIISCSTLVPQTHQQPFGTTGMSHKAGQPPSSSANTTQTLLMPGEDIDTKLKEWINMSSRLIADDYRPTSGERQHTSPKGTRKKGSKGGGEQWIGDGRNKFLE